MEGVFYEKTRVASGQHYAFRVESPAVSNAEPFKIFLP
jgi:hypothetical protein